MDGRVDRIFRDVDPVRIGYMQLCEVIFARHGVIVCCAISHRAELSIDHFDVSATCMPDHMIYRTIRQCHRQVGRAITVFQAIYDDRTIELADVLRLLYDYAEKQRRDHRGTYILRFAA